MNFDKGKEEGEFKKINFYNLSIINCKTECTEESRPWSAMYCTALF